MNIVVDTSVLIAVIVNEAEKRALVAQTRGAELFAPRSLHWEIGNAFSAMFKRQRITVEQAKTAIEIYQKISLNLVDVDLAQALELAAQLNVYAYDAYVRACAIEQKCPLLTLDGGLMRAAKTLGIDVLEVTDANGS